MILIVLTIAFVVIVAIFTFKTAKENGYSAFGWTALSVVLFFGIPFVAAFSIGIVLVVVRGEAGAREFFDSAGLLSDILIMAPGVAASMLILKHVSNLRDDEIGEGPPPPGKLGL